MSNKDQDFIFTGALDDNRSPDDKAKDYQSEEIASGAPVAWRELNIDNLINKYTLRNQDGSGSCVAQTLALMLGIENAMEEGRFIELSASHIYNQRRNNGGGMIGDDAMQIGTNQGATLEVLMPSQEMNDKGMSEIERKVSDEQIGKIFKGGGYVGVPRDLERIASLMAENQKNGIRKPIMIWFKFPYNLWSVQPGRVKNGTSKTIVHHSVTGIEFGLFRGRKVLVIQDSWGHHSTTMSGLRFIDQEFILKYMTYGSMLYDLRNDWSDEIESPKPPQTIKPKYNFNRTLRYGMQKDRDVIALQDILKYEGMFAKSIVSTGNYYQITAKALLAWQLRHYVAHKTGLKSLQGRVVGPKTRKMLNKLYN